MEWTREGSSAAAVTVVLDNPERRNAISIGMWDELTAHFRGFVDERSLRVVVLRGAAEGGAFSAGADVSEFPEVRGTLEGTLAAKDRVHAGLESITACPVPVVAVIDGPCIGAGLEIALCADLRLASAGSSFGLPVVRLGSSADPGDIRRLALVAGPSLAAELLFSAAIVPAERAHAAGLLNWIGPTEALERMAQATVGRIVAASPRAVRVAKLGLRLALPPRGSDEPYEEAVRALVSGEDFREGTRAFLERRSPLFTGL